MNKRVYIVEDLEWLRETLREFLSIQPGLEVCGTAACAEDALKELPAGADIVTLDLGLADGSSGLDLLAIIQERWPSLPCVVLSGQSEIEVGAAVRDAGAAGYVEKGDQDDLIKTLYSILGLPPPSAL